MKLLKNKFFIAVVGILCILYIGNKIVQNSNIYNEWRDQKACSAVSQYLNSDHIERLDIVKQKEKTISIDSLFKVLDGLEIEYTGSKWKSPDHISDEYDKFFLRIVTTRPYWKGEQYVEAYIHIADNDKCVVYYDDRMFYATIPGISSAVGDFYDDYISAK